MEEISRKMAAGAVWMIVARITDRLLGLASTLVLVRLLVPADFGLLAMATSIIALIGLFGSFSFDLALIQNPRAERRHYDTVWTFSVLFAVALAAVLVLLAAPAARFYSEPRLTAVMEWLAAGAIIGGLGNVGVVAFRKEMQFDKEFRFLFTKKLISVVVTIVAALTWRDYWALVAGTLAGAAGGTVLSYLWQSYRPKFSLAARGELFTFSKWLFFNNIIFFFNARLADFIVGRTAGPHALGLYSVSLEISNLPTSELAAPVNRAVFPGYSKLAGELAALRGGFLNVLSMIALLALPAGAGIAAVADLLVPVVLGPAWTEAVILIQILALYGVCQAMQTNTGITFIALGKPQLLTLLAGAFLLVLFPSMLVLTKWYGAVGAAAAVAACAVLFLPINYFVLMGRINLRVGSIFAALWRPALACVLMVCVVNVCGAQLADAAHPVAPLLQLAAVVTAGAASYFAALFGLWRLAGCPAGAEQFIWNRALERLGIGRSV